MINTLPSLFCKQYVLNKQKTNAERSCFYDAENKKKFVKFL